ncbi:MAG: S1 RNA-binding domain-containing protein [Herpetosiphon sp.]
MTDAQRASEHEGTTAPEQTEQASGSLLGKLVEKAKDVAGTVADKARDVVTTVGGLSSQAVGNTTSHEVAPEKAATPANGVAERSAAASANGTAERSTPVAAASATASAAVETVRSTVEGGMETIAETTSDVAAAVRRRISRVYGSVVGSEGATFTAPSEAAKGGKPRRFKDVTAGMELEGKVTSIALYGIFVDVGVGRDGLVHISEMSDKRIESPTEVVQIGTVVKVWVKSVDAEARRISLTMRDPNRPKPERTERRPPRKPEINREKLAALKAGDNVDGVISSLAPFGAFVDIGAGKDGLVHISELAEGRIEKPEDAVTVGQHYTFRVLEVDPEGNRISLSLRRAQRTQRLQQLEPGTELSGTISGLAPFGAFVDVGVGRDGLVHVSELSNERVNKVEDIVKVGDKVQVKVIEVDPNSKRISLTMRVDEPMPAERPRPPRRAPMDGPGGFAGPATPPPAFGNDRPPMIGRPDMIGEVRPDRTARGRVERRGGSGSGRNERDERPDRAVRESDDGSVHSTSRRDRPERNDRGARPGGRSGGGRRDSYGADAPQEVYTVEDPEEEGFSGDASLEDLLSKFNRGKGHDQRKTRQEQELEDQGQQRNDAISRTLAMRNDEE